MLNSRAVHAPVLYTGISANVGVILVLRSGARVLPLRHPCMWRLRLQRLPAGGGGRWWKVLRVLQGSASLRHKRHLHAVRIWHKTSVSFLQVQRQRDFEMWWRVWLGQLCVSWNNSYKIWTGLWQPELCEKCKLQLRRKEKSCSCPGGLHRERLHVWPHGGQLPLWLVLR